MKPLHTVLAFAILSTSFMGRVTLAQDHHEPIKHEDWDRGDKIDYHHNHLSAPPRGYEWRMVDGQYVLANSSTFQIRTTVRVP
jgi:Ni/Co efflux regulator RcnB